MPNSKPVQVVIPAAGLGRRMKSYGPKALIKLNERETVLSRQLRLIFQAFPNADVVVVGGFEQERVRAALPKFVTFVVNEDYESTNVAASIRLGMGRCLPCYPIVVIFGDLVFGRDALDSLDLSCSCVLMEDESSREHEVGANVVDGCAVHFSYGLPNKWAHIAVFNYEERHEFVTACAELHSRKRFTFEIMNDVIDRGGSFKAIQVPGLKLAEIDTSRDIANAKKLAISY